jgi:predicted small metal-binding protein
MEEVEAIMVDVRANPDYESSSPFGAEEHYREFTCKEEIKGKECGFKVWAKTDDEVIEHAHMHQKMAHNVKDISPDLDKKIKDSIRPVSSDGHKF